MGTKSDGGGGLAKKILTEAKTAHLMQNKAIFGYFKHEIQLFKVLLSLKVVNFDTKMYLNFSNFRGQTSAGEGQALVQKRGQVSDGGELAKFSPDGGTPQSPQEKNPAMSPSQVSPPYLDSLCYSIEVNYINFTCGILPAVMGFPFLSHSISRLESLDGSTLQAKCASFPSPIVKLFKPCTNLGAG